MHGIICSAITGRKIIMEAPLGAHASTLTRSRPSGQEQAPRTSVLQAEQRHFKVWKGKKHTSITSLPGHEENNTSSSTAYSSLCKATGDGNHGNAFRNVRLCLGTVNVWVGKRFSSFFFFMNKMLRL